jgi:hypothetical protein
MSWQAWTPGKPRDDLDVAELKRHLAAGLTYPQIAAKLDRTHLAVSSKVRHLRKVSAQAPELRKAPNPPRQPSIDSRAAKGDRSHLRAVLLAGGFCWYSPAAVKAFDRQETAPAPKRIFGVAI